MSVWDAPDARPPESWPREGEAVEATITRIDFAPGRYGQTCQIELDRDGRMRFAPKALWRTLYQLRPEIGDRVRISRLSKDEWRVDRLAGAVAPMTPAEQSGPHW